MAEPRELHRRAVNLLTRAAQSDDPELCCNALEALARVAPDEGLPYFRAALRSEYPLVRFAGLTALGTLRDKPSLPDMRQRLSDNSPMVRLAAAFAAYRCGLTGYARRLVTAMTDDPDENVRAEAAHLIGLLEDPRALKRLRAAGRRLSERSDKVLVQIYTAMARLGDDEGLQRLIEYTPGAAVSRLMALQGLAEVARPEARDALRLRLNEPEEYLIHRLVAARALAKLGLKDGYDLAMRNISYVSNDPEDPEQTYRVRANAALTLGEIGDPRALGALRKMAEQSDDPRLQVAASYAICLILQP